MSQNKIIFYKGDDGGCGVLRMIQPAKYLEKLGYNIRVQFLSTARTISSDVKVCVFQRDYLQPDAPFYWEWLKDRNIKIIYDLDDDIFDVPPSNPNFSHFKRPEIRSRYEFFIKNADLVTVSTQYLKTRLENLNSNIEVLPNCIDFETWPSPVLSSHPEIRLGWAGSPTHYEDLMLIFPTLKNIMKKFKNVHLYFLGYCPSEFLKEFDKRIFLIEGGLYNIYQLKFAQMGIDIGFIPLVVNNLNKSKSPVKYLEYSSLKIPSIASFDSPYKNVISEGKNGFLAKSIEEWEEKISLLIRNPSLRKKIGEKAYQHCFENFNIQTKAKLWEKAYLKLVNNFEQKTTVPIKPSLSHTIDDIQLIFDQFNIAKLFVKQKDILVLGAHFSYCFELLLNSQARRLFILESDQLKLLETQKEFNASQAFFTLYNFDFSSDPPIKNNFDMILGIDYYKIPNDKRKFLMRIRSLLKNFGTAILSHYGSEKERQEFLQLTSQYFKITNTILMQEKIETDSKFLILFGSPK